MSPTVTEQDSPHELFAYIAGQLAGHLKGRRVVVWYDLRREFEPFLEELAERAGPGAFPAGVAIGEVSARVARFAGSYFGLRAEVEPLVAGERPDPLLVYIPGVDRDRQGSVLMELERAGTSYEPQLRRLATNVLRKRLSEGQIDELLRAPHLTYQDIVAFLREPGQVSVLHTIFAGAQGEELLVRWLADEQHDPAVQEKGAEPELLKLIAARLGLTLPEGTGSAEARQKTLRYVLVGEFRADLRAAPPTSVGLVPVAPTKETAERVRQVAAGLRRQFPEAYLGLADRVEKDLDLAQAPIDPAHLGSVDTFRFEEDRLLGHAAALVAAKRYDEALAVIAERGHSFWVDRFVARQAQWEACRLMAELGREVARIRPALDRVGADPAKWVAAYAAPSGWHQADRLQRRVEAWVARMDDEPVAEQALAVVRREHEELLKRMADGFTKALQASSWSVVGVLPQTQIYPEVVQPAGRRVAFFLVDALRYEMGAELAEQLQEVRDLTVRPAVAALPSITPVGMAALLPGASASFSVVDQKGSLAARVDGAVLPGWPERLKFLKARVPGLVEMTLGKLLTTSASKLSGLVGDAPLVLIRSQEIDYVGEVDGDFLARQVMDSVVGNLARAIRKLAPAGVESVVVTADHGHQFSIRKEEDMRTESPGGVTVDLHRRCWVGRGGTTPAGTVRLSGQDLGYDTDIEFVFPTGLGVFKAGGGLSFHHGGFSLQELVVPVVSLRLSAPQAVKPATKTVRLAGLPRAITNRTFGVEVHSAADLFATEPVAVRVVLLQGAEQVGQAGMAVGGDFERRTGTLMMAPRSKASLGLMLTRDDCKSLRVVALDPATDAVLDQSDEIPVKLGI